MTTHLRRLGAVLTALLTALLVVSVCGPAKAAQVTATAAAPYGSADHYTFTTCPKPNVAPRCSASSAADARSGHIDVAAAIDSGVAGTVPGQGDASAVGDVNRVVDLGSATAATFTAHVRVLRAAVASRGGPTAYLMIGASASCDACSHSADNYVVVSRARDEIVSVTLVRDPTASQTATFTVSGFAGASDDCDDFCLLPPSGTATASAQLVLSDITVRRWGVGKPDAPVIEHPAAGQVVHADTYGLCQPDCREFRGERITGTAEPGMTVQLVDGRRPLTTTQADGTGHWVAYVDLSPGRHSLTASAIGRDGRSSSARDQITVGS